MIILQGQRCTERMKSFCMKFHKTNILCWNWIFSCTNPTKNWHL